MNRTIDSLLRISVRWLVNDHLEPGVLSCCVEVSELPDEEMGAGLNLLSPAGRALIEKAIDAAQQHTPESVEALRDCAKIYANEQATEVLTSLQGGLKP